MCGICGIFHYRNSEQVDKPTLAAMNDMLTHRGPDDAGFHIEGPVGIAMRRLIIIDPNTGHQPIYNEKKNIAVICNGEIYNFPELRQQLIDRGHTFSTKSDCEVIVHLYEEKGLDCVHDLQGMFAFAVWDSDEKRLFVARDRIGIKPLYYADNDGTLLFGSEAKAVLRYPGFPRRINPEGLHHYLSLNYVPAPFTLIEGLEQLHPGEFLVCTPAGVLKRTWWDLRFSSDDRYGEKEWTSKVADCLERCVSSHLMSDVPFGAFLSGGIDSSAVVGYMTKILGSTVSTFSIAFEEKTYSEAQYSRQIAERFDCDHHEIAVTPDVISLLETLIWHADDPLADSSMIPVYLLSEFSKKHVTMVLTGDGGDEVFAGYDTYNAYYVQKRYRMLPAFIRRQIIRRAVDALPVSLTKVSFDFKAKRFVRGAELDPEEAFFWWRIILAESAKNEVYSDSFKSNLNAGPTPELYKKYFGMSGSDDPLSRMLYVDTRFYLPSDMLVKVDRMTMANALEARVPFLDHELVELAARIPSSIKFKRRIKKYILKQALAGMLPPNILHRKKAGFNVPVNAWLAGDLNTLAREILAGDRLGQSGFFNVDTAQKMLKEHEEKKFDHSFGIWSLMCFQMWYELFMAPDQIAPPADVAQRWGIS